MDLHRPGPLGGCEKLAKQPLHAPPLWVLCSQAPFLSLLPTHSPAAASCGHCDQLPRMWWLKTEDIKFSQQDLLSLGPSLSPSKLMLKGFPKMPPHGRLGHVSALRSRWCSCSSVCGWHVLARGAASPAWHLVQPERQVQVEPCSSDGETEAQSVMLLPTHRGPHPSVPVWVQRSQASATSLPLGARWEDTLPRREAQTSWPEPRQVGPAITSLGHLRTLGPGVGK